MKKLPIKRCCDCSYYYLSGCQKELKKVLVSERSSFPPWCPLPDAEEGNKRDLILEWAGSVKDCDQCDEYPCHYHCTMLDIILDGKERQ